MSDNPDMHERSVTKLAFQKLQAEKQELIDGLKTACELAEEAMAYVDEYFIHKWGMKENLASAREILAKHGGQS